MKIVLGWGRKVFYRFFPSGHVSAYIRTLYLKRSLRGLKFQRALDAGCGPGAFTLFLAQRFPEAQLKGYDISGAEIQKATEAAKEKGITNVIFEVQDLRRMEEKDEYDFIFSLECLEHIHGNQKVIGNFVQALSPGGVLFIMMPCEKIHKFLFPRNWFEEYTQWTAKEHIGDQYTLDELVPILEGLGVRTLQAQYTFGFWGKLAWELSMLTVNKRKLHRLLLPMLLLIGLLDVVLPLGKGSPYGLLVLGQKVEDTLAGHAIQRWPCPKGWTVSG
ncbi:MAG: class I SAM-dependent methyltransferase [bacterium]|nr:class I SAM-dependent methyltransferase [bacterium]